MAAINASATISSVADGPNFDYTVQLANSRASTSVIGTFWYAWAPTGGNYLATSPISVTPAAGWNATITHAGPSDGYGIEFVASNPAYDVQPGGSLNFSFVRHRLARIDQWQLRRPPWYARGYDDGLSGSGIQRRRP